MRMAGARKGVKLMLAVAVPLCAGTTFADCFYFISEVDGVSMQPTLNPQPNRPDWVLLNKRLLRKEGVNRGDIVSLISPNEPETFLVKRIVALEGDTVRTLSYKNKQVVIPTGHCWVEGDNHKDSADSNSFGPVPVGLITSKSTRILWPPSRMQRLDFRPRDADRVRINNSYHSDVMSSKHTNSFTRVSV